jgi:FkbM family methyltransferase
MSETRRKVSAAVFSGTYATEGSPPVDEIIERTSPGGITARLHHRGGTNDGAIAQGILEVDEYRLASIYPITGWVLDIGAHIGTIAIAIALDNPDAKVVAVEALPQNVESIRTNIELNDLAGRVFVEGLAATDSRTKSVDITYNYKFVGVGRTGEFVDSEYLSQCRYVGNIFQEDGKHDQESDVVSVPGISLTALLHKYDIDRVALLKIDCEGCEYAFFRSKALSRIDRIVGEFHDARTFDDLKVLLEPTHVVEQWTGGNVGLFGAVAR